MSIAWTTAVDGAFGNYFDTISNSMASMSFSPSAFVTIETIATASRVTALETTAPGSMTFTGFSTTGANQNFVVSYESGLGSSAFSFDLIGTINNGTLPDGTPIESFEIRPDFTMGATGAASLAFHSITLTYNLQVPGNPDDVVIMYPGPTSTLATWSSVTSGLTGTFSHPGLIVRGGENSYAPASGGSNPDGETGIVYYDEPTGQLAGSPLASFIQHVVVYNRVTKKGIILRTTDKIGTGKYIKITRSGNNLTVKFILVPPDNSTGKNNTSDYAFPYGVEMRPFSGTYYDALVYIREKQKLEGHPAFEKGRIKDRPLTGTNMYPEKARRALMFSALGGGDRDNFWALDAGNGGPTSLHDDVPFNFNTYVQEATRLKSYFELDNWELACSLYGWWTGVIGSDVPNAPFSSGGLMAANQIRQAGITSLLYTIPIHPQKIQLPGSLGVVTDGNFARTRVGYSISGEPGLDADDEIIEAETALVGVGNDGLLQYLCAQDSTNALEYMQYIRDQFLTQLGPNLDGFYFDAHNAFAPPPNDDYRVDPEDRGIGSTTWTPANRNLAEIARTQLNMDRPIIFSEHPADMYVSNFDFVFDNQIGASAPSGTPAVGQPAIMWSEYTRFTNFAGYSVGPKATEVTLNFPGLFDIVEGFNYTYSYYFHLGQMASFISNFGLRDDLYIHYPGEPEYYEWWQASENFYIYLKRLYVPLKDKVRNYQISRRLRDLPTSPIETSLRIFLDADTTGVINDTASRVHTSVWYDSDNDVVAVWVNNWSLEGHNPVAHTLDDTMTLAEWPELGSDDRDIYLTNAETGSVTKIGTYDGSVGSYTFNLTVTPGDVFLVEFVPAGTQVSFSESSGSATIDAPVSNLVHRATRLRYPGYASFPFVDHYLEADVRFTPGVDQVGIWMLGGRKGADLPVATPTYDLNPYDYSFHTGSARPLEQNSEWNLEQEPGVNDERVLSLEVTRFQNVTAGQSYYNLAVRATDLNGLSTTIALSPPSGLIVPSSSGYYELTLRLEAAYVGFSNGQHLYDVSAYVNNQLMLDRAAIAFPERYFTAVGYPAAANIQGPPVYAGIFGQQTGQYTSPGQTVAVYWDSFISGITGSVNAPPTGPTVNTASGEARPKDYFATRYQVPNRARNGGFIGYPASLEVQRLEGVITADDPTYEPPTPVVPLHVIVLLNGSDSMTGGETHRAESFLEQMVRNLPTDGSVALTAMAARSQTDAMYGAIYPNVAVFIPTRVVDSTTISSIIQDCSAYSAGNGQERWQNGLQAVLAEFQQGVPVNGVYHDGWNKMLVVVDDEGSSDVGITRAQAATEIDALHALSGLVECGVLSVNKRTQLVVGNGLGQGSWDVIFPRPDTAIVPNTPLVDTNYQTTDYISTETVPNTTGALCARTFRFIDPITGSGQPNGGYYPPDAPIIQNPPLQPLTSWPNNAGTHYEYSEWCGYTWAQQIIKRRDTALVTLPSPQPPTTINLDAYVTLPALHGYSLDIPPTAGESVVGHWEVFGAPGSLEIAPLDEEDEVIPSLDGGNLARVNFGANGEIRIRQEVIDSRPFRGRKLSLAYTGRTFEGRVRVDLILEVDGEEQIFHTAYSSNFGEASRWVEPVSVPFNFTTLAVVIKLTGKTEDSVGLSGIQMALGEYNQFLPYSEPLEDSIIAPGTVVMTVGDSCPAGYREVPNSSGRLAFAVTGDPNFYQRSFSTTPPPGADPNMYTASGTGEVISYPAELDLVLCVDWSNSQRGNANNQATVKTWLKELLNGSLPRDGSVRVGMVAHGNNFSGGASEIFPLTVLDIHSAPTLAAAVDTLPSGGAHGDQYAAGLQQVKLTLENSGDDGARMRMVFCNFDTVFNTPLSNSSITSARDELFGLDRFTDLSIVAVGASRQQMLNVGWETFVYSNPSTAHPGILFAATGGFPGTALPNAYSGQPFLAGQYAAQVLGTYVQDAILAGQSFQGSRGFAQIDGFGGQKVHEHSMGALIGSSLDETDGFENPLDGLATTPIPVPLGQTAAIKPYPFGFRPDVSRPEDPPVLAIGPGHSHTVHTDMEALPPSFPVRYCEKL